MTFSRGHRLGNFEVQSLLGTGGMGEVYLARDLKLGREVAVKVLPPLFASDERRLERMEREARALASVNHPNVGTIYGYDHEGDTHFLVLELVPGHELGQLLGRKPLNVHEALDIFCQIAHGLQAAHQKGLIHRDLKPANIKIRPDGRVKILDFGIARILNDDAAEGREERTVTLAETNPTEPGRMIGTLFYMSPEQARGASVDRRSDIWSFGVLFYEALTGERPFDRATPSDTLAAIFEKEPDWNALPAETPPEVRRVLRRCLQKDPERRLHDIADARLELCDALENPGGGFEAAAAPLPRPRRSAAGLLAVVLFLAAIGGLAALWRPWEAEVARRAPQAPRLFAVNLPEDEPLWLWWWRPGPALALSPDGTRLVYAVDLGISCQLYLRDLGGAEAVALEGTEDARNPFFSPDGQSIAFFVNGSLRKLNLTTGESVDVCEVVSDESSGGFWSEEGDIVFTPGSQSGIYRVSAEGGEPEVVTTVDEAKGERGHDWPQLLPGGRALLYTIWTEGTLDNTRIVLRSLETDEQVVLAEGGANPHYVDSGHVVFGHRGQLLALPIDPERLEPLGPAVPVLEGVRTEATGAAQFALADDGTLVYVPGDAEVGDRMLEWVREGGRTEPLAAPMRNYREPRLAPACDRLAVSIETAGNSDIWVYEFARRTLSRLTFEGNNFAPVWAPDGRRVAFVSDRSGWYDLFWKAADDSEPAEILLQSQHSILPTSFSPDGQYLAYSERHPESQLDLWILPLSGEKTPEMFLKTAANERKPMFSPDGRWIAYESDESGRREIHVKPFPGPGESVRISAEGGREPVWSPDGESLYYRDGERMMEVVLKGDSPLEFDEPAEVFEAYYEDGSINPNYDVDRERKRFLMVKGDEEDKASPTILNVVLNWYRLLEERAPHEQAGARG